METRLVCFIGFPIMKISSLKKMGNENRCEKRDIEDYSDHLEGSWLLEDGLDDENSDNEYRDGDGIIGVLQEQNDDDDVVDETDNTDPLLVEEGTMF
ncbi:hypothetical protein NPIL_671401 [Nephila pilipes]|uniref:Uncharacterized protein n=1 Tax=Nephila pilipes TaxID=299642 RepID=A0A8X6Q9D1_NEPPI|nr:hypothetical protein NPIL_671401 [Nephila pilipes]